MIDRGRFPQGATRLIAKLADATAPDFDLYVGKDEVAAANVVASSASGGSAESVDIALGEGDAGDWWILVQNWDASTPGGTDTVDLEHAVVSGDADNLRAEGPASQPAGEPFTIRTFWDEPRMRAGQTWYGSLTLSAAPGGTTIGTIPVTVDRFQDDVTKTVDATQAAPGETLTYTVEVQPNVTPEDLTYTFNDQLPKGTTFVEGSGPEGATVEDGVLTWQHTMPTPVGAEGDYTITTSAQDESCVNPATGEQDYFDLASLEIAPNPSVTGDGVLFTAFGGEEFGLYENWAQGLSFSDDGLVVNGADNWTGDVEVPQELPDVAAPNNIAAGLWQDMQFVYDEASGAGVSLASGGALKVVEFDNMRLAGDGAGAQGTTDFQVIAVAGTRDLAFAYDNVEGPLSDVTIGTENADGTKATALVNQGDAAGVITDGTVVCMTYANEFPAAEFTYQVTVDDDVLEDQVLRNRLTHTVDNPGARAVQLSSFVTVVGGAEAPAVKVIKKRDAREGGADGVVMFKRPRAGSDERLTVFYDVRGTAAAGRDYRPLDGSITFQPGKVQAREFVQARNRKGQQGVRRVRIVLTEGDRYTVGSPKVAVVKIHDARRRR